MTWQPGDPLAARGSYGGYLFSVKDDAEDDECHCSDAAKWPEPRPGYGVSDDALEAFIAGERSARERGSA